MTLRERVIEAGWQSGGTVSEAMIVAARTALAAAKDQIQGHAGQRVALQILEDLLVSLVAPQRVENKEDCASLLPVDPSAAVSTEPLPNWVVNRLEILQARYMEDALDDALGSTAQSDALAFATALNSVLLAPARRGRMFLRGLVAAADRLPCSPSARKHLIEAEPRPNRCVFCQQEIVSCAGEICDPCAVLDGYAAWRRKIGSVPPASQEQAESAEQPAASPTDQEPQT